jgi:WD40 repeat protein
MNEDAHKAGITSMGSDDDYIYTGCKENIVKAWQFKELSKDQIAEQENQEPSESENKELHELEEHYGKYKVDVSSYMIGHDAPINSICPTNDEYNSIFTGSSDKSLKLWRR